MKKMIFLLMAFTWMGHTTATAAMSVSKVRKEARFLTDKMGYELNLSNAQYNDVYEINYDFIYSIRYVMDDVVRGYDWAMEEYYTSLDFRNDDLRYVLNQAQYRRFLQTDYFYRPIYASGGKWFFRVYITYTNHNHFYFDKPYHYRSYAGAHYRSGNNRVSFYVGRYSHPQYRTSVTIRNTNVYTTHRRSDFGTVTSRPSTSTSTSRRSTNATNRVSNSSSTTTNRNSSAVGSSSSSSSTTNRTSNSSGSSSSTTNRSSNSGTTDRGSSATQGSGSSTQRSSGSSSSRTSNSSVSTSGKDSSSGSSRSSSGTSGSSSRSSSSSSSSSRSSSSRR
ncbi:MAG: hypothetical protein LUF04_11175 [Bacteroides sp.]|nr:hypothetical protein [Bacteroides sp.]